MLITQDLLRQYFSVNDVVASGGGRRFFRITDILDNRVRIQPTESATASRLRYEKLSVVINQFENIDPNRIEITVGDVLSENGMRDTQNESYLYGMAREYLNRQNKFPLSFVQNEFEKAVKKSQESTSSERKARLKKAPKKPKQLFVTSTSYQRNSDVVAEVLDRAKGVCEKCKQHAPFIRASNNTPYLEVHHIVHLADDGDDTVDNSMALCPNCHRECHFGVNAEPVNNSV